jgi:chitodextrinase
MKNLRAVTLLAAFVLAWIPIQALAQLGSLVVNMTAPASGATVSGTVPVSASVTIVGLLTVQSVQFKLDGANLGAADTSAPYAVSWNTTGVANGSHTLSAVATAVLGLQFSSPPITVTVSNGPPPDTTPPGVSMTSPANGATVSATVAVSAGASDNVGVAGVQFRLDGANLGSEDTAAPYSVSWNTTGAANGSHTLTAVARDAAGNHTTSSAISVTVSNAPPPDTTPPSVSLTAPSNGATVSATVTVSANASDNVGVAGVQFRLDGANLGPEDTSAPYSVSWNTTGVGNGSHTLTAVARDAAGNQTTSTAVTVTVSNAPPPDTTPPTVSITSPANGATVQGAVMVSAGASDNVGVVGVQFFGDGMSLGAEDTTAPYSIAVDTTASSNGSHVLTAVARDAAGNRTTSAPVTVTVSNGPPPDTTPPSVSLTAPGNGATVQGTVTVSASASDNVSVAGVQFRLDGANLGGEDTAAPYSVSWSTTGAANGSHTLTAVVRDAAGNVTTSTAVTVTVSNGPPPDTTPPSVSVTSPANGATVRGMVTLTASASDNVGVVGVQFFGDGMALAGEVTTPPYSVSVDSTASSDGSHTLTAVARDAAGNVTTSTAVTVTVSNAPPPDTTPPSVSLASPANGTTLQGTVTVSASASDSVGVAGVQFKLDGANLGAENTSAPYAASWNTNGVGNGSHTLTAVARDAAGNVATSAAVTVTVSNAVPTVRVEETDPSIAYTAGWSPDPDASLSNGAAAVSDASGAQATFTFTGTSVSWIGGRSDETGIARVSVDGSFVAEIDTYSKTKEIQVPLFTAVALSNTNHTLTIEVTGQKNAAATLAFVIVDAFDVPAATLSRLQETDPSVAYTAGWIQGNTGNSWSGGTAAGSLTPGDQATFTFAGTGIRWLSARGPQHGIARISLDGAFVAQVDAFAQLDTDQVQAELFKATGLADASHTLTIEVTGQKNVNAGAAIVTVDAFEVTTSGTRREETDPAISYTGGWSLGNRDHPYSEGTAAVSTAPADQTTFTFTGTSVSWIGFRGPQTGVARVILDGNVVEDSLDTYSSTEAPQSIVFTMSGLAAGSHTLTIQATGSKNPASGGTSIVVDAFDVTP